ncbi:MAG: hypothetical protein ACKVQJ_05885 [Pyrinomonadaceae bacterium]
MKQLFLTIIMALAVATVVSAANPDTLTVRVDQQKTFTTGKIVVKFISVVEDSRCPEGVACIWAGNAKIKISLKKGKKSARVFDLNSTLKPEMILFEGYEIRLVDLTPRPGNKRIMRPIGLPSATLSIEKHVN